MQTHAIAAVPLLSRWLARVTATLFVALMPLVASAQSQFADALRRSNFAVLSGDVNSDGYVDVLLKATPRVVIIDFDVLIPIVVPSPTPTFAIISNGVGGYYLDAAPSAAIVNSPVWQAGTHDLVYGDLLGSGGSGAIVEARNSGVPSFSVAASPANGAPQLVQHLTQAAIGVDLGAAGVTTELRDINGDSRSDLLVKTDGVVTDALIADANGMLTRDDETPMESSWYALTAALSANDINTALQYFSLSAAPIYLAAFNARGNLPGLAASWSPIKAIEVTDTYATFSLFHTEGTIRRLHTVTFVLENGRWVIASL